MSTPAARLAATNGRPVVMPPGVVGVIAQDTARFSAFPASLTALEAPPGTAIRWVIGHQIASNTNVLARALVESPTAEWLWILGDDHAFAPDLLLRLLARNVDIVAPLCLTRTPPYKPVMCADWAAEGGRLRVDLDDHPDGGLVEIHSSGSAGMLIRRHVLEAMGDPWFESGLAAGVEIGEDYYFCDKAREAGFAIHGDLDARLGHITTAVVWPTQNTGRWTYGFSFTGGLQIAMPPDAWDDADEADS